MNKTEELAALQRECLGCDACPLGETRTKLVFGVGNPEAEVMLIGEGPGEQEDLQGVPFVGRAGKLLDDMLAMFGLSRADVYIANIVKCRPPKNRDPLPEESEACYPWLEKQIALIRPRLLVCLGRIAAMRFIDPHYRISREHGQWVERDGMEITAVYHPAALLRDPRRRPEAFDDMKEIARKLRELSDG
jgi:DNA polymerase